MRLFVLVAVAALLAAACSGDDGQNTAAPADKGPAARTAAHSGGFPSSLANDWSTDFSKASVAADELTRAQAKDGIPAISQPKFLRAGEVTFLGKNEPVIAFELAGEARAYPLQILIWHEIVNDVVAGRPVLITFCPLCNTAIAFDRTVSGRSLEFGVTGFLRNSDLVMFDRQTETWWQQLTGEAIVGELNGKRLELLPSSIVSWADFAATFPDGMVLSRDTGHRREYGKNPYTGYDDINASPFLFDRQADSRLAAMERVVTVELGGDTASYPFSRLEKQPVAHDTVGGNDIVILFKKGTISALDRSAIADSRDVGTASAFKTEVEGRKLTFRTSGSSFVDAQTGSQWDVFGRATSGPLKGMRLEPMVSGNHFWFAWAAFHPETKVWAPQ